jgi:hypothetical protein
LAGGNVKQLRAQLGNDIAMKAFRAVTFTEKAAGETATLRNLLQNVPMQRGNDCTVEVFPRPRGAQARTGMRYRCRQFGAGACNYIAISITYVFAFLF